MTNEEMERAIEFLLTNQANMGTQIERTNQQIGEINKQIGENNKQIGENNKQISEINKQIGEINKLFGEQLQTQTEFIQVVARTFEAQSRINQRTDERLDKLTSVVEWLVNEGRNGNS